MPTPSKNDIDGIREIRRELRSWLKRPTAFRMISQSSREEFESLRLEAQVRLRSCGAKFEPVCKKLGELDFAKSPATSVKRAVGFLEGSLQLLAEDTKAQSREGELPAEAGEPDEKRLPTTRSFQVPEDSTWADVRIRFTDDHHVQVSIGDQSEVCSFASLGFEDGRGTRGVKPVLAWDTLRDLAIHDGSVKRPPEGTSGLTRLETSIQNIRKVLIAYVGIQENPILYCRQDKTYRTQFKVEFPHSDIL